MQETAEKTIQWQTEYTFLWKSKDDLEGRKAQGMDQMENHSQEAVTGVNQDANNMSPEGYQNSYGPAIIMCLLLPLSLMDGNVYCSYSIIALLLHIGYGKVRNLSF